MPKVNVTRTVKCSADSAVAILADVKSYRHFLPFVRESAIGPLTAGPDGGKTAQARMRLAYKKLGIDEQFVSTVVINHDKRTLEMTSKDGPLKNLEASWLVTPVAPNRCELTLKMDLTLKSIAMQFVLAGAMDYVVRKLFNAFEERAQVLQNAGAV